MKITKIKENDVEIAVVGSSEILITDVQSAIAFLQKQSGSMHVKQELQDIDTGD